MAEVAITSTPTPIKVEVKKEKGKLLVTFYENVVDMKFEGDVTGKSLDLAIRLIPRRYKLWRNTQLTELKNKEK